MITSPHQLRSLEAKQTAPRLGTITRSRLIRGAAIIAYPLMALACSSSSDNDGAGKDATGGKASTAVSTGGKSVTVAGAGASSLATGGVVGVAGATGAFGGSTLAISGAAGKPIAATSTGGNVATTTTASVGQGGSGLGGAAPATGGAGNTAVVQGGATASSTGGVATAGSSGFGGSGGVAGASGPIGVAGAAPVWIYIDATKQACNDCMLENCNNGNFTGTEDDVLWPVCSGVTGTAQDGPARGKPKKQLCQDLYACMNAKQCVKVDPVGNGLLPDPCYCGSATGTACLAKPDGACKAEFEAAAETTDPTQLITQRILNIDWASGYATSVMDCVVSQGCFAACTHLAP